MEVEEANERKKTNQNSPSEASQILALLSIFPSFRLETETLSVCLLSNALQTTAASMQSRSVSSFSAASRRGGAAAALRRRVAPVSPSPPNAGAPASSLLGRHARLVLVGAASTSRRAPHRLLAGERIGV